MVSDKKQPYHARMIYHKLLWGVDGCSAYKLYGLSLLGRDHRERYEWAYSEQGLQDFERKIKKNLCPGVGFITAFPHVCKIFRFSVQSETLLDVREYHTTDLSHLDCYKGNGFHEFACLAEALIAAEEYRHWAGASTVVEYLDYFCGESDFLIESLDKLEAYLPE